MHTCDVLTKDKESDGNGMANQCNLLLLILFCPRLIAVAVEKKAMQGSQESLKYFLENPKIF